MVVFVDGNNNGKGHKGKGAGVAARERARVRAGRARARARVRDVVPMEITFMDNGGYIFVLYEFIDYMNLYII